MSKTLKKLFVIMPFGTHNAHAQHGRREIDFDFVYTNLIKSVGESAGWDVLRIDEVTESGVISDQYLKEIFAADMVVADVSISNANVYYELGIRHAISAGGTILLALKGTPLPFDIAHLRVLFYELDSDKFFDIKEQLKKALLSYSPSQSATSNPVREFLEKVGVASNPSVNVVAFEQELYGRISRAHNFDQLVAVWQWAQNFEPLPALALLSLADRLAEFNGWQTSVEVLRAALKERPNDFELYRQIGWHLRHLGPYYEEESIESFKQALKLNPGDLEALGMLGGIYKRRGDYARAAKYYDKGVMLSPDSLYMKVNQAALKILTNPQSDEGRALYEKLYVNLLRDWKSGSDAWAELVCGECAFAIKKYEDAEKHFKKALQLGATAKALRSAAEQLELLGKAGFQTLVANKLAALLNALANPSIISVEDLSPAQTPQPLAQEFETPVIIHLSDIHFGSKMKDGQEIEMHRFRDGDYEKRLSTHLISEFKSRKAHFAHNQNRLHLVISGDLTYRAEKQEFERVDTFLNEVCEGLEIPKERVVLVPGNHDVHWNSIGISLSHRFDNYLIFLLEFYGETLFRERYPLVKWNFQVNTPRPEPSDLVTINSSNGITIVGLNSCVYETDQDHYGFVGGQQLEKVSSLLDNIEEQPGTLKVAALHHHLHPYPESVSRVEKQEIWVDLSTVRDAGLVERRLEKLGFDIVLHGHKHKPQLRETLVHDNEPLTKPRSRLIVCGAGSTGVNGKELEQSYSNHYQVIETLRIPRPSGADFLSIEWRELSFIPDTDWTSRRWVITG